MWILLSTASRGAVRADAVALHARPRAAEMIRVGLHVPAILHARAAPRAAPVAGARTRALVAVGPSVRVGRMPVVDAGS